MARKGSLKGKWNATFRVKIPTSDINQRLSLDQDHIKGFISEHICGLIQIYNLCGVKNQWACDLFYDIIFLNPVTTRHFSQFQQIWPHCRSSRLPLRESWAVFRSYMGQMFDKTCDQTNNWSQDNPHAFVHQVNRSCPKSTSYGKIQCTGERFTWYISNGLRAKIEPPSCRQYTPGDFLTIRLLNWDEIIDADDYHENWAETRARSSERSCPSDGNAYDDSEGEEDMEGGEKGTREGKDKRMGRAKRRGR